MSVDRMAVSAGTIRLASGLSFLIAPEAANRLWGDREDSGPTASLLLRSMGYRDALIGGLLLTSGVRGDGSSARWFLASAGGAPPAPAVAAPPPHPPRTAQPAPRPPPAPAPPRPAAAGRGGAAGARAR